jgi:hypothetical protein
MRNGGFRRLLPVLPAFLVLLVLSGCPTTEFPSVIVTVDGSDTALVSGGTYSFGDVAWGGTKAVTFTISNNGTADLTLTADGLVSIGGADSALFAVTALPSLTVIPVSGTATFTVTFSPADVGSKAAMVTIGTDFPTDPTISFMLTGRGVKAWRTVGTAGFSAGTVTDVSLAVDQLDGTPYVAYIDASLYNGYPVVQKLSSETWSALGDAGIDDSFVRSYPFVGTSLCISDGYPSLAYVYNGDGYCMYVGFYAAGTWNAQDSFHYSSSPPYLYVSLKIDDTGRGYVAFCDTANGGGPSLYYNNDGYNAFGMSEPFASNAASYTSLGLARDPLGATLPYIAFKDDSTGKANVYCNGDGMMSYGTPDFSDGTADYTSLAIDSNDVVYVAYADGARSGRVTVMKNGDNDDWHAVGSQGFSAGAASYVSLVCDRNDTLYVAYKDGGSSDKLTVQKCNGTNWETVGTAGFSGGSADYVVMGLYHDTPYVAFRDGANGGKVTVMKLE